jgi:DeoR family transcriptional regulator, fructose operon transcriptional repressor
VVLNRYGFTLKVKAEMADEYRRRHTAVWPDMLDALRRAGWHNYSLFLAPDGTLFGYVETPGTLAEAQAAMAEEQVNERWQAGRDGSVLRGHWPAGRPDDAHAGGGVPSRVSGCAIDSVWTERDRAPPARRMHRRTWRPEQSGASGGEPMSIEAVDRLEQIEHRVRTAGRVRVTELAVELAVSEMTIRRDLDLLAEQGMLQRVRGGAVAVGPQPFAQRFSRQARAKERNAAKLAELVGDGGAVGVGASSTIQRLAGHLGRHQELTVVTNGQETFQALQETPGVTVLLTGGQLDRRTGSLVGPLATRAAREVLLRRLFVSAAALDPEHGTSEATLEEAEVKLAMAEVASEVVVAVDATKLGQRAPARGLPPERVHVLVTDLDPGDPRLDPYRDRWRIR